jgi:hypothetical protein
LATQSCPSRRPQRAAAMGGLTAWNPRRDLGKEEGRS